MSLQTEEGAEKLLDNAELFGLYLVEAIASPNVDVTLDDGKLVLNATFNNICNPLKPQSVCHKLLFPLSPDVAATVQDSFNAKDVVFPVPEERFSLQPMFGESLAHIKIPAKLLELRANETSEPEACV